MLAHSALPMRLHPGTDIKTRSATGYIYRGSFDVQRIVASLEEAAMGDGTWIFAVEEEREERGEPVVQASYFNRGDCKASCAMVLRPSNFVVMGLK